MALLPYDHVTYAVAREHISYCTLHLAVPGIRCPAPAETTRTACRLLPSMTVVVNRVFSAFLTAGIIHDHPMCHDKVAAFAWPGCSLHLGVAKSALPVTLPCREHGREIGGLQRRTRAHPLLPCHCPSAFLAKPNLPAHPWLLCLSPLCLSPIICIELHSPDRRGTDPAGRALLQTYSRPLGATRNGI